MDYFPSAMAYFVCFLFQYAGSGNVKFVFVGNKVDQKERRVNVESGEQVTIKILLISCVISLQGNRNEIFF